MLSKHLLKLFLLATLLSIWPSSKALAGTTGVLAGTVRLNDGSALAGAHVTAVASSEAKTVFTDGSGYFVFLSLPPDAYTVTVTENGYDTVSLPDVRVLADNTRLVTLSTRKTVLLGVVKVKPGTGLLQPGVVADVYSINAQRITKTQLLGGGANLGNIYSALSAVPGVIVPPFQNGPYQYVNIRGAGGLGNTVGYEYDGVPVNRSFDNASSTVGSNLGQRELQVYVGSAPANAEAFGLGGFINQVIKSGAYPGFGNFEASLQSPNFYNGVSLEVGGATPSRSFSYYVAMGGYNYSPRYYDNFDGASVSQIYGFPVDVIACPHDPTGDNSVGCYHNNGNYGTLGPGGFVLAPYNFLATSSIADRETVTNFHFRIPHHHDEGGDDVQLLYSSSLLRNPIYSSAADLGQAFWKYDASVGGSLVNPPAYVNGYQYLGHVGEPLTNGCPSPCDIVPYSFPSSNAAPGAPIPESLRDSSENVSGLLKLQYQHNVGSRAYLRLYAYSLYSSWFLNGPNEDNLCTGGGAGCEVIEPGDYELSTHTRGASATYAVQLDDRNLLNIEGSYVTATTLRDYNGQYSSSGPFAVLVDAKAPVSGFCFQMSGALGSCEPGTNNAAAFLKLSNVYSGGGVPDVGGLNCNPEVTGITAGPCEWLVVENGPRGAYNQVRPKFTALSLTDEIRASAALQLNVGLRFDHFVFAGADTTGPARTFWFNAWNKNECFSAAAGTVMDKLGDLGLSSPATACPAGTVPATMYNASNPVFSYALVEPRIGGTYALGDNNVLRLSYSEIGQPPNAAYEQYNYLQQNLPKALEGFYVFGFNTPGHSLGSSIAHSLDASWEHRFGSDLEFKLTPYLQKTSGQYEDLVLDQRINFFTALPAAKQTSDGAEFELQKGSFERSGLSWLFIYNYFHQVISYTPIANGATFQTVNDNAIRQYNAYTSFCASNPADDRCGLPTNGKRAAPCYDPSGNPVTPCMAGLIANPYWKAPLQSLFTTQAFPTSNTSHTATLVLNYKIGLIALTPTFQFLGGARYGLPLAWQGIDPASNCTALSGSTVGDSRYPYGASRGSPYDARSCLTYFAIPDPYTRLFDGTNAFVQPASLLMNFQVSYDVTPRMQMTVGAANLINTCWGGTKEAWTAGATSNTCVYQPDLPMGNFYNPDSQIQPYARFPYFGYPGNAPISLTFQMNVKM